MKKTGIISSPRYLDHNPGVNHPESPKRLEAIIKSIKVSRIIESGFCCLLEPETSSLKDLKLIHSDNYITLVKKICEHGGGLLDIGDTVASPDSYNVARLAVGGVIKAIKNVYEGKVKNSFAFVRPPGHHAGKSYAMGFCIFNNIAVAASYLIKTLGLKRVLILDIDAHHGNGTQEIFFRTKKVLYVSLHMHPLQSFPGTGFIDEIGKEEGLGYTVNIPFPLGTCDSAYFKAFKDIIIPIIYQYRPEFILISAGFDGYYNDQVAGFSLSAQIYPKIFKLILRTAKDVCFNRVVAVLEGGYKIRILKKISLATLATMAGFNYKLSETRPRKNVQTEKTALKIIEEIKQTQSFHWSL
jgi:acetoin utilization deacetylase AcuC-like enzyme